MDNETKIHLSSFEKDLLNNSDWILTKNIIIKKAQRLFEKVQENIWDYSKLHSKIFPQEVTAISPKISKGENYKGLPWLMLDYPRYFDKENIFAIRAMFWWGNFFSTTLHLSGRYKQKYSNAISISYSDLKQNKFYICIHEEQWQHHFEKENYASLENLTAREFTELLEKKSFIKLSCKFSFDHWDNAIRLLSENFARITTWMA